MKKAFSQAYPMAGGDGPHSYSHNSQYQRKVIDAAKGFLSEGISNSLDLENPYFYLIDNPIRVADFGSSVGPNTFISVENIIEAVKLKYHKEKYINLETIEFHVFFNDHITNDFNILFKSLPPTREYYAIGTPGSFHGQVLPKHCLHIGHTSYTLHWLSRVPPKISDRTLKVWNKDSIYCTDLVKEVAEAYSAQFMSDAEAFLRARKQEIVPGGLMLIAGLAPPDGVPVARVFQGVVHDALGSCLFHMAKLGLVREETVESFNLPVHFACVSKLVESIERNGSFRIEKLEKFTHPMDDKPPSVEFITGMYRALYHGIVEDYFGKGTGDELFDNHLPMKLREDSSKIKDCVKDVQFFILLKRKYYY